jgi:MATE family multidrug resistance protein
VSQRPNRLSAMRAELRPMVRLAVPVIVAEVGWTTMGLVDTLLVGPLGPTAIGAVGFSSIVFLAVGVFGMGLLLGLDTVIARAHGAGRPDRCHRWLVQGAFLSLLIAGPLTLTIYAAVATLPWWGLNQSVLTLAVPYLTVLAPSVVPLLFYATFRRYLQATNCVRPITFALLTANLINAVVGWMLIYGKWGLPSLGATGSAWATMVSRIYMVAVLLAAILLRDRREAAGLRHATRRIDWRAILQLLKLGVPASMAGVLEVGVFAAASALVGRLSEAALAAHQIALNLWGLAYMIPLGLNAVGAVRVGQAVGRRDREGVWRAGWTALALGAGLTTTAAAVFLLGGHFLIEAFSRDPAVLAIGPSLLGIAGLCLVFDGTQSISTGILRGLGETRVPMLTALVSYWAIALPLGYAACFTWGWGVQGMWAGLAAGLVVVGAVLLRTWHHRVTQLAWH